MTRARVLAVVAAGTLFWPATANATDVDSGSVTLSPNGPLTSITTTADLNCAVRHEGDTSDEFFGVTACGTLVATGGTLYGPASIPAGSNASPRTPWEKHTQQVSGLGTNVNPYRITTNVDGGYIHVKQTDSYVEGSENYATRVEVTNTSADAREVTLYRAADCYLQDSDIGYGRLDLTSGAVACAAGQAEDSRIEQWAPLTPGSNATEGYYATTWSRIGQQQQFADTCDCDTFEDNSAGLSWTVTIPAGATSSFSHLTAFSPNGQDQVADSDGDSFPDSWESPDGGVDTDGDGIPDLKLSDYGATPDKPDVFVQVGRTTTHDCAILSFICHDSVERRPTPAAMSAVEEAYGEHGIRLHIDAGSDSVMNPDTGEHWGSKSHANGSTRIDEPISSNFREQFDDARAALMPHERDRIFHFALYTGLMAGQGTSSGLARGIPGRDFMLAAGAFPDSRPTFRKEAGTFAHELGHTLGLTHGGAMQDIGINDKPNYPSVMNYQWQFSWVPKTQSGNTSPAWRLDYSPGNLANVDENHLDESAGLEPDSFAAGYFTKRACGSDPEAGIIVPALQNIDWTCDGTYSHDVRADINRDGSYDILSDHADWGSLIYDGSGSLGGAGVPTAVPGIPDPQNEPTLQQLDHLDHATPPIGLVAPGLVTIKTGTDAPVDLVFTNHSNDTRTYKLGAVATAVQAAGIPAELTLTAGQTQTLQMMLSANAATDDATVTLTATTDADPADQATVFVPVHVVEKDVPGQPIPRTDPDPLPGPLPGPDPVTPPKPPAAANGAITILDTANVKASVKIDGASRTVSKGAPTAAIPAAAGKHTIRVQLAGKKAKAKTISVALRSGQITAVIISGKASKPAVKLVAVGAGQRRAVLALSGRPKLRTSKNGKAVPLAAVTVKDLPSKSVQWFLGKKKLTLPAAGQLLIVTQQGRSVKVSTRGA